MMNTVLTARERVQRVLMGQTPDRLPIGELTIDDELVLDLVGLEDETLPLPAKKALLQRWGHDLVSVSFSHGWGSPVQPDPLESLAKVSYWAQHSDLFTFALVDGPFSMAVRAWGWEQALLAFARMTPEVSSFLADAVIDMSELFATLADLGANGVILGDDIAYRRGPYVNPEHLRASYFPFLALLVATAQDMGLKVAFHSDGNLWPIWSDILRTGVDAVQGLDPYSAMSLPLARARSGDDFCLWGNLDIGWVISMPSEEAIRAHLDTLLTPVAGSPVIFGASSGLNAGLPLILLDHLYKVVRERPWSSAATATNG